MNKRESWCPWSLIALLALGLSGSLASILAGSGSASSQSTSVAMFRSDAAHSGVYQDASSGIYGGLLWSRQTGGPVRSSATIVGDEVLVGSSDGHLYALDANDGSEKWRFEAGGAVESTPAVANGRVFFSSANGAFYAIKLDGKPLWKTQFGPDAALEFQQAKGTHPATYSGEFLLSSAAVLDETVVVGSGDGGIYALDAKSGRQRWKFQTGGRVRSSPAISNGLVYAGSYDGSVYAIDLNSGKQVWRYDTQGKSLSASEFGFDRKSILSSPAVSDGVVFIGSRDSRLYALDAATGTLKWKHAFADLTWTISSPAVREGVAYTGTADGHFVSALRAEDGHELWQFKMPYRVWSSPAVAGTKLYITNQSGGLYAIDLASGTESWRFQAESSIQSSASVHRGVVYFGDNAGRVYAIRADAAQPMQRAVYFDEKTTKLWAALGFSVKVSDQTAFRDFFRARGYDLLDATTIGEWLEKRISDHAPSVIAFATPSIPDSAISTDLATSAFRRYLNSGGKAVWIGYHPPMLVQLVFDKNHSVTDVATKWDDARNLLGVSYDGALQDDLNYNRATNAGRAWGLPEWWLGTWDVRPSPDITPLSLDDRGSAGSWVRHYGGVPGTGFVYIGLDAWNIEMLNHLALVAEYRPR